MKFTPQQLRDIVGLSQETLRYWRRELLPLKGKSGASPLFTPGDALALSVIKELVERLGIRIQFVVQFAEDLFSACSHPDWATLENHMILFDFNQKRARLCSQKELGNNEAQNLAILVVLRPHVKAIRTQLLAGEPSIQMEMKYPPLGIKAG